MRVTMLAAKAEGESELENPRAPPPKDFDFCSEWE